MTTITTTIMTSINSLIGFSHWIGAICILMQSTPLHPFSRSTILILGGLYMVTVWTTIYRWLGTIVVSLGAACFIRDCYMIQNSDDMISNKQTAAKRKKKTMNDDEADISGGGIINDVFTGWDKKGVIVQWATDISDILSRLLNLIQTEMMPAGWDIQKPLTNGIITPHGSYDYTTLLQFIDHYLGLISSSSSSTTLHASPSHQHHHHRNLLLFFFFYPLTFSFSTIIRFISSSLILTTTHLVILRHTLKTKFPSSILSLWKHLFYNPPTPFHTHCLRSGYALSLLPFLLPLRLLALLLPSSLLWMSCLFYSDKTLRKSFRRSLLSPLLKLLPPLYYLEMTLPSLMLPYVAPFGVLMRETTECYSIERLMRQAVAGGVLGVLLTVVSVNCPLAGLILYGVVCGLPYGPEEEDGEERGVRGVRGGRGWDVCKGVLLGVVLFVSVQVLGTGFVMGYYVVHPWRWWWMLGRLPLFFGVWICVGLVGCQVWLYRNDVRVRMFLFDLWVAKERSKRWDDEEEEESHNNNNSSSIVDGVVQIKVDSNKDTILQLSLYQIHETSQPFEVKFGKEKGVDAGGLQKQWAALLSRTLVVPPEGHVASMLRVWEKGSDVYDVNYEFLWAERMKRQQRLMQGGGGGGDDSGGFGRADNDDEQQLHDDSDTLHAYRKLGAIVGHCFLQRLTGLPKLSRPLCKFLLRERDNDINFEHTTKHAITWEDVQELFPEKALHMADPIMRQYCDYTEVTLDGDVFTEGFFTYETGLTNGYFHQVTPPKKRRLDELARRIVLNNYADEMREYFRKGFRSVVSCEELGDLFSASEIQELLSGSSHISISDWKQNTVYRNCTSTHPVILLFWKTLKTLSQSDRRNFCEFATGQPTPPSGGFSELRPVIFNIQLSDSAKGITARTCSNGLELPGRVECMEDMRMMVEAGVKGYGKELFNKE